MENNIKVSVIIPVYNVENYLKKCLDSVINQTLKNIEIICINDGSTDNSLKILEEYSKKDNRIIVLNQENQGQSIARNNGLKIAKGEFIGFVDSDDYISLNFYEKLYNSAKKYNSQIAVADIFRFCDKTNNDKYILKIKKEENTVNKNLKFKYCNVPRCCYIWNKIYKREELLKTNIRFKENKKFEDVIWLHKILFLLKGLSTITGATYYYRNNSTSTVNLKNEKTDNEHRENEKEAIEFVEKHGIKIAKWRDYIYCQKRLFNLFGIPILSIRKYGNNKFYYLFDRFLIWEEIFTLRKK